MAGGGDRRGGRGGGSEDDRLHNFLGALWPRYFGKGELFFYPAPGQTRPTQRPRRPLARLSDSDQVEEAQAREYAELLERTATRRETVLAFAHLLRFSAEKDSDLLPVANDYSGIGPGIVIQVDKMLRALQESSLNAAQGASVRRAIASLGDEPAETLGCLGLSLCLAAKYVLEMSETAALEKIYWPRIVPPKDFGSTPIGNLRGAFVGRFICATGTVVRASKISLLALGASFKCERCGHICDELVPFRDGKYEVPLRCVSPDGCKVRIPPARPPVLKSCPIGPNWKAVLHRAAPLILCVIAQKQLIHRHSWYRKCRVTTGSLAECLVQVRKFVNHTVHLHIIISTIL
jgi:hypothetical protein